MTPLPPWLDFTPQGFASAAEAGRRLNQGDQQIGLERQKLAESASQAASQLRLEGQKLDQAKKQAAMEHQVQMEQLQNNFLREQTQASMAKAYHDAQIGLGEDRVTEQAKAAAFAHADRLAALTARTNPQAETFSRHTDIPAKNDEVATVPASAGHLWGLWGAHPEMLGHTNDVPKQTLIETVKAAPGTSPATAFAAGNGAGSFTPAAAPAIKFVRDENGKLVIADNQPADSQPAAQ